MINKAIILTNDPNRLIKLNEILGDIYYSNLRKFRESADIYNELIMVKPRLSNFFEYKYRFAESLFLSNKFDESLKVFSSMLNNFPKENNSKIKFRIALIHSFLDESNIAINLFKEIIDGDYNYSVKVKSSFFLAGIYEESNKLKLASKYYNLIKYDYPNTKLINQKIDSINQKLVEVGI